MLGAGFLNLGGLQEWDFGVSCLMTLFSFTEVGYSYSHFPKL